jgi:hypothetical protein
VKTTGYTPFSLTVRVPYGNKVTVNAVLPPVIALIGPRPFYQDWPFYTAAGVGVAFIAAAGFLHHDAVVLAEDAQICADNDLVCEREKRSQSDSRYLQAYVLYGLGSAGLAAAGLIMILDLAASDDSSSTDETMAGVRFGPAPAGLGLTVNWRF